MLAAYFRVNLLRESGRKEEVVYAHLPDQGIRTVRDSVRRRLALPSYEKK
jgi:uncharacterized protein with GYD domain